MAIWAPLGIRESIACLGLLPLPEHQCTPKNEFLPLLRWQAAELLAASSRRYKILVLQIDEN